MNQNFYIEKYSNLLEKNKGNEKETKSIISRIQGNLASLCLSRNFNETIEAFEKRNPSFVEFSQWYLNLNSK